MRTLRDELTEVIREMPGLTAGEIIELMPHTPKGSVASMLNSMFVRGQVLRDKKPTTSASGRAVVYTYTINPDPDCKPPVITPRKSKPTDAGWQARIDCLEAALAELREWKSNAIARYPDLDVDPVTLEARQIVAEELRGCGDNVMAADVIAGKKDTILPMRVTIAALNKV